MFCHRSDPIRLTGLLAILLLTCPSLYAQNEPSVYANDVQEVVRLSGRIEHIWRSDAGLIVRSIRGNARLTQGQLTVTAPRIVVFERQTDSGWDVRVVAKESQTDRVRIVHGRDHRSGVLETLRLATNFEVESSTRDQQEVARPDTVMRSMQQHAFPEQKREAPPVRVALAPDTLSSPGLGSPVQVPLGGTRRITIRPRTNQPFELGSIQTSDTIPPETSIVITGGVNVLVEGTDLTIGNEIVPSAVADLSADRVVIWVQSDEDDASNIQSNLPLFKSSDSRFQVYLEGNILVRHKGSTVEATHAFFDGSNGRSLLLNAELRATVPATGGDLRIRAERLRQLGPQQFHAQNAWTSASPYGKPGYRIESRDIFVEPGPSFFNRSNPGSGPTYWITAEDSRLIVGDTPLLSIPRLSVPAEDPGIPLRRASAGQDRVFGFQVRTVWDMAKLVKVDIPPGAEWDLLLDYYSQRGPMIGTQGEYDFLNRMGQVTGEFKGVYQYDGGLDNLGLDRRALIPRDENRGQLIARHRQRMPNGMMLFGEIGFISDRNYLEQFDEFRFDRDKDVETIGGIRQDLGAFSGSLWVRPELYEYDTTTEWLPRADIHGFSVPLLDGTAYWSSHSSIGYAHLDPAELPTDPADPFSPTLMGTPWLRDVDGLVAMTRHQLDAPFSIGPVNFNPWVMGEAAHWDEGLVASDINRFVGSAGVRATLVATKVMPFVSSEVFNLNGLAHKSEKSIEWSVTDSSQPLAQIASYNEFDENAQERLRNRAVVQIFPGMVPPEFDPRFYAVRNGAGLWVSAPYHELVDDQQVVRLRWRNRLQTKVGPLHNQRIRDWMIWENGVSYFPDSADNFGEHFGLLYSNYRWNLNDRTSLLADGVWDFFTNAQRYYNLGVLSQRSTRGSVYLAYRHVEAHNFLRSEIISASYSYRMSPKWISTAAVSYDVAQKESRGLSLTLSRVGLDWVFHTGFGVDTSKDNVGVAFSVEPRWGPPSPTNLGYLMGLQTP